MNKEFYWEVVKAIFALSGFIFLYVMIDSQQLKVSEAVAKEQRLMERAKLTFEILKVENPERRAEAINFMSLVYGDENGWLRTLECKAIVESKYKDIADEINDKSLVLAREVHNGSTESGSTPGYGAVAMRKNFELIIAKTHLEDIRKDLDKCGINTKF